MMLILKEGEVYFLDRDNSVFISDKFFFPRRKNPDEHVFDTLVDGVSCFYFYFLSLSLCNTLCAFIIF